MPLGDHAWAYASALREIATQTGTEWNQAAQERLDAALRQFEQGLEALTHNAPPGSEPFVAAFKQAVGTGLRLTGSAHAAGQKVRKA